MISARECRQAICAIHVAIRRVLERKTLRSEKFVFLGGGIVPLLITDPAAAPLRPTKDVDVVFSIASTGEYSYFRQELLNAGFHDDILAEKPLCALFYGDWRVDFLTASPDVIGGTNRWFADAISLAEQKNIEGQTIWVASTPAFLATKLEAWSDRGRTRSGLPDYYHQDIEDIIAVLDGRIEASTEILSAPEKMRDYLHDSFAQMLDTPDFRPVLAGHTASDERAQIVMNRIEQMVAHLRELRGRSVA